MFIKLANKFAVWFATPWAIFLPWLCSIPYLIKWDDNAFNVTLSVISLNATQLILMVGAERDKVMTAREDAMQKKLDSLVEAIPEADNALIGSEPQHELA